MPGTWYTVEFIGLGGGGSRFTLSVDDITVPHTPASFPGINFNVFSGPLYVGGHPSLSEIQVSLNSVQHKHIISLITSYDE